jgi:hypothetical protein
MQEETHKRGLRSKTWKLDDAEKEAWIAAHPEHEGPVPTHHFEAGGGIAHHHHPDTGELIDTDINWADATDKFHTGDHPFVIDFVKATRTLSIDFKNGDVITLSPKNIRTPTAINRSSNVIEIVRLWTGMTLKLILTPEGLHFHYIKTSTTYVDPSYDITGPYDTYYGKNTYTDVDGITRIEVPESFSAGVLSYDFSLVPVGVEVD